MRWRRPLAALAAACVVATAMVALTATVAETARSSSYRAVEITPNCAPLGTPGSAAPGVDVHLGATSLSPGANAVTLVPQNNPDVVVQAGSVTVGADGSLDQDITVPPLLDEGLYNLYVSNNASLVIGLGYFATPCPTLSVTPTCGPADDGSGARYALTVSGTNYGPNPKRAGDTSTPPTYPNGGIFLPVHIELDGVEVPGSPAPPNDAGTFSVLVTPARLRPGVHTLHSFQTSGDVVTPKVPVVENLRDATTTFTVPCPNATTTPTTPTTPTTTPTTTTTAPTTAPTTTTTAPKTTQTTTTTTTTTPATAALSPSCLEPSATATSSIQVRGGGFSPGAVDVLLDGDVATKAAADGNGNVTAEIELTPGTADRSITVRQGSRQADATLRVPCASHPKLKLDPPIGPPGFVTKATGSGFPPNVRVVLAWSPGIGTETVQTNDTGAFVASMLVFPQDRTGARVLRATPVDKGRFATVDANFLCVPGSVQRPQASTFDFRR